MKTVTAKELAELIWDAERKAERKGSEEMRERIAVGLENHEPKLSFLLIAGVRAQPLPGDGLSDSYIASCDGSQIGHPDYSDDKERDRYLAEGGDPH